MNPKVRSTLTDDFCQDQACAICGQKRLRVVHLDAYPDYVNCDNCSSAFVVEEGGERVMYGKIPAQYPETRHFALQQWVWPEAIDRKAGSERSPAAPGSLAAPPPPAEPEAPPAPAAPPAIESLTHESPLSAPIDGESAHDEGLEALPAGEEKPAVDLWAAKPSPTEAPSAEPALQDQPEVSAWPPTPQDAAGPDDAPSHQPSPISETSTIEPSDEPPDEFSPGFDQTLNEGLDQDTTPSEMEAEPEGTAEPAFFDEPDVSPKESVLGDEEDLLDSIWGDEPYPTSEVKTAELPEPPPWATDIQAADEDLPPESQDQPRAEDEPQQPVEADQDTGERLHTWGTPQPKDSIPLEPPVDKRLQISKFPWDAAPDEADQSKPPTVAPFEASDWASDAFDLPDEATKAIEDPAAEMPTSDVPAAMPAAEPPDSGEEAADHQPEESKKDETPAESSEPALVGGVKAEMAKAYWGGAKGPPPKEEPPGEEPSQGEAEHHEPPPGNRYRVVVKGSRVRYPESTCAHCLFSPAAARLPILASITLSGVGDRQIGTLRIPVCADCKARASARSEEQRTAQLQAHLIGVLVALVLVVCVLLFGFINLRENFVPALLGLTVLAGLGYVVPAVPLLLRASRLPKPPDSEYVKSTLRVPGDTEGTETAFEWRNQDYARRFLLANTKVAVSEVTRMREQEI